jgi:hypothetical protein
VALRRGCGIEQPHRRGRGERLEERWRRAVQRDRAVGDACGGVARGGVVDRGRGGIGRGVIVRRRGHVVIVRRGTVLVLLDRRVFVGRERRPRGLGLVAGGERVVVVVIVRREHRRVVMICVGRGEPRRLVVMVRRMMRRGVGSIVSAGVVRRAMDDRAVGAVGVVVVVEGEVEVRQDLHTEEPQHARHRCEDTTAGNRMWSPPAHVR